VFWQVGERTSVSWQAGCSRLGSIREGHIEVLAPRYRLEGERAQLSLGETVWRASGTNATSTAGRSLEDEAVIRRVPSAPVEHGLKVRERPVRMSPR
jgi:hypothetical protein